MRNAGLDEAQTGIKIAGRNSNNLKYADDTILMAESEEELKSLMMKVKEESAKTGLKLNVQKLRSWHTVPLLMENRWENNGNSDRLYFLRLQNHHSDCSHDIKRCLLLDRKAMMILGSVLKSTDSTLQTKVCIVKAIDFLVAMYRCGSLTIKKAEC